MAKNISSKDAAAGFRRLDVDQYDDNSFRDDVSDLTDEGPNESEVNNLLMSGKAAAALKVVLQNPPVQTKDDAQKEKAAHLVVKVLSSIKSSEVQSAVKQLEVEEVDVLMKYIYKGFSMGLDGQQCGTLLQWHGKALQEGGKGCIVRVLSDRKRL